MRIEQQIMSFYLIYIVVFVELKNEHPSIQRKVKLVIANVLQPELQHVIQPSKSVLLLLSLLLCFGYNWGSLLCSRGLTFSLLMHSKVCALQIALPALLKNTSSGRLNGVDTVQEISSHKIYHRSKPPFLIHTCRANVQYRFQA